MIIKFNKVRLKVIPLTAKNKKALAHYKGSEIVLTPGFNDIPEEVWKELKENSSRIREDVKNKHLVEFKAKVEEKIIKGKDGKPDETVTKLTGKEFNKLSEEDAKKVIEDTWTIKTLEKFAKDETRDDIRNTILDRIKGIKDRTIKDKKE